MTALAAARMASLERAIELCADLIVTLGMLDLPAESLRCTRDRLHDVIGDLKHDLRHEQNGRVVMPRAPSPTAVEMDALANWSNRAAE